MKKHPAQRKSLPRPARTMIHCFVILLCLVIMLIVVHLPALTPQAQYRRLEQGYMVGPTQILGTETVSENGDRLLIGKSDTDLILYRYKESEFSPFADHNKLSTDMVCREKRGDLAILFACGRKPHFSHAEEFNIPIILFDDYPKAVRAEVEFTLFLGEREEKEGIVRDEIPFVLKANRSNDGYFYFSIYHTLQEDNRYTYKLEMLASISAGNSFGYYRPDPTAVTVRLYDAGNQLIVDKIIYFRTAENDFLQQ